MSKAKRIREQRRAVPPPVQKKGQRPPMSRTTLVVAIVVAAVVIAGIAAFAATRGGGSSYGAPSSGVIQSRLSHDTLAEAGGFWPPNPDNLPAVMSALNLPISDPAILHHHAHLDLFVNGKRVVVPANVGLSQEAEVPIHTHDTSGVIHIESSSESLKPTLGILFDDWGVYLSPSCIGGYCAGGDKKLWVFANGKQYSGDPRQLPLDQHEEIVVAYGTRSQLPAPMTASYAFPAGE